MAEQKLGNSTSDTLPRSVALTGTVTCAADSKELRGTSTLFLEELRIGDTIYDNTNGEIRTVASIQSNTQLRLNLGFTNALSGATVKRVVNNSRQTTIESAGGVTTITFDNDDTMPLADGNTWTPKPKKNGIVECVLVTTDASAEATYDIVDK